MTAPLVRGEEPLHVAEPVVSSPLPSPPEIIVAGCAEELRVEPEETSGGEEEELVERPLGSVEQWYESCVQVRLGDDLGAQAAYQLYRGWCGLHKEIALSSAKFAGIMKEVLGVPFTVKNKRGYYHITVEPLRTKLTLVGK